MERCGSDSGGERGPTEMEVGMRKGSTPAAVSKPDCLGGVRMGEAEALALEPEGAAPGTEVVTGLGMCCGGKLATTWGAR